MLKYQTHIFAITIAAISLTSCSKKVYFTPEIKASLEENNIPLTSLQYYTDTKMSLRRNISNNSAKVSKGEAVIKRGTDINVVKLGKSTPGALLEVKQNSLKVAFEEGENKGLTFIQSGSGAYVLQRTPKNTVEYDGYLHSVNPEKQEVTLQIKRKVIKRINIDKRKMKGKKA
jgi:hypothetical protein